MTYTMVAQLGDWTFWAWDGHPFESHAGKTLYSYELTTKPGIVPGHPVGEWFPSIDRAMIAAVGEKYAGPRGAGGTGVGTAADWFARMIGMDTLVEVDNDREILGDVLVATAKHDGPIYRRANAMEVELTQRGMVLARRNQA
jgi:hypothetical protein